MSQPVDARASYCYRHPDRVSYVLCQRCGRTICGECQTPAAVGFVCPECMAQQRATAPKTKPAWIPRLTGAGAPVVTYAIIAVCVVVFILQSLPFIGGQVTQAIQYAGVYSDPRAFEPWRMLTSVFAHASIIHILLNMYTLWIFGSILEPMLGRLRFLGLFLISGFAGSLGVLLLGNPLQPVVGASGAIFGMFGAFFIIQRRLGGNATQILVLVALNIGIGFLPGLNIAWQAHVGGLIGGVLVGLIYVETRKASRRALQLPLIIVLSVLLIALSLIRFL
ncbi:rhomboid family intramembrane serine protease [Leifsonia aquatica]|uniref:Peptidase, S54 family n=2 Tax=Leifsonia aquatica TaxID=144185 RepID=U2T6K6_LEIAQ|nr:rhomboid family intramembrane serine protease [Leifsonia aquatica]ERK73103.1 peptidase, S54 family [Leifsonia aquatica ATCC 14665]MBB2967530.1 membrane associated rhomboid family serine protease [Leifsonia aquatica]